MAKREFLDDNMVEMEIARLSKSENVKLARREQRLKYARRQQLYTLRALEKRGKELAELGYSVENMDELIAQMYVEDEE